MSMFTSGLPPFSSTIGETLARLTFKNCRSILAYREALLDRLPSGAAPDRRGFPFFFFLFREIFLRERLVDVLGWAHGYQPALHLGHHFAAQASRLVGRLPVPEPPRRQGRAAPGFAA